MMVTYPCSSTTRSLAIAVKPDMPSTGASSEESRAAAARHAGGRTGRRAATTKIVSPSGIRVPLTSAEAVQ